LELAQQRGMRVWNWSVDTEDWKAAGSADVYWVDRIVARARAGLSMRHPVILMHNQWGGNPATVAALPKIIHLYREHGYRFVDLYGRTGQPRVHSVTPATGTTDGGVQVTLDGAGFLGVRAVRFGTVRATSVRVESATRMLVTAPAHAAGVVDIRVTTTFGISPIHLADRFTYSSA
jgi:hypothetical protein